ncbi:MAG: hypothetical protein ACE5Q6_05415 [Dehalococcoidia bacterium]
MTWGEAFSRAGYYVVAHIVLAVIVGGTWLVGAYFLFASSSTGITGLTVTGGALILAGIVVLVLGGPAIWIKVIGDIVSKNGGQSNGGPADSLTVQGSQVPIALMAKSAEELIALAEELGATFSIPGPGRVQVDHMDDTSRVPPELMAALRSKRPAVIAILEQRDK